ncbi:MAG: hotdog fold thioesterase [Bacteroidetes bacterium]|nr:hotdog fold thioesterase [Bacteroidota bacterium]MBS1633949.1 hotdog fold thioesterase [Bacteroidota bacterium]
MSIWYDKELTLEKLKAFFPDKMARHVGIEWVEIGDDFLRAKMPVDHRTQQPYGFLHGGASCVLAETTGSVASALVIDQSRFYCVGLEINANHIRSATKGFVTGTARPLHLGSSTHVWDIRICDESDRLICVSRLTVAILPRKS